jgi:competence protein ComEC
MASVLLGFAWTGFSTALDTLASLPMMWTVVVSRLTSLAPVLEKAGSGMALAALAVGALVLPAAFALTGRMVGTPFGLPLPFFKRSLLWLRRCRPRHRRKAVALAVAVVICGVLLGGAAYPAAVRGVEALRVFGAGRDWPEQVEVRVLDIGQGNAVLVRTPERHSLLFDGGPAGCDLGGQLHGLGVRKLDLVVISHPHADHFAGLAEALGGLTVGTVIDAVDVVPAAGAGITAEVPSGSKAEASAYLELRRELAAQGTGYVGAATGYTARVDGVTVRFYAPAKPLAMVNGAEPWAARGGAPTGDELNGASLVAMVSVGAVDVLIPGDAEADVLGRYALESAEVLVVPHHGSRGGVSLGLLDRLGAGLAVISVGADNPFGHPDPETISILGGSGLTVLRTDTAGWVCCSLDGDSVVITTERTPGE